MQAESTSGRLRRQRVSTAASAPGLVPRLGAPRGSAGPPNCTGGSSTSSSAASPAPDDPFVAQLETGHDEPAPADGVADPLGRMEPLGSHDRVRPVAALRARRLHPQPAAGATDPRHRRRRARRPLRRTRPDGLPLRVRGDRHRRPAERGPSRAVPGRPDADGGRRRRRPGLVPLPLHDRPQQLPVGVVRHGLQRREHRAHHAGRGRAGAGRGPARAQAGWRPRRSTRPMPT